MKNHLGSYECKLCLTLHNNEVQLVNVLCTQYSVFSFSFYQLDVCLKISSMF